MATKTDFIAYCGVYCRTCPSYTHSVANLARDLRKELRRDKWDKVAPALAKVPGFIAFKHYDKCYDVLGVLMKMRCKDSCRNGGGSAQCPIRKCAKKKGLDGCWQCDDFASCKILKMLEDFGDADQTYRKNLRKIKRQGPAAFVRAKSR